MSTKHTVVLPAPTYWPLVTALGVTLLLAGLVTHWVISLAGMICGLRGALGWFFDVFPVQKLEVETVEVEETDLSSSHSMLSETMRDSAASQSPPSLQSRVVIASSRGKVAHLSQGVAGHRVRYPEEVHPISAGIKGGLLGGVVMALMALLYGFFAEGSLWLPVNLLAAIALPSLQNADFVTLKQFSGLGLGIATLIHVLTSCFVGLLLGAVLPMFPRFSFIWAGLLSPLFWSALSHATLMFIDPAMAEYISWPWFIACQFSFALVAAYSIKCSVKIETLQTYPLAERAGLEASTSEEEDKEP